MLCTRLNLWLENVHCRSTTPVHHHLFPANKILTATCRWEARNTSPKVVTVVLQVSKPDTGPFTHRELAHTSEFWMKGQRLKTLWGLSNPTWLLIVMLFTADLTRDFCLPSRSTWAVAGFRGLNRERYTSSSKPVELGHDERVCVHKKKVHSDRRRKRNPLSGNILLCTSICCSVRADSLDGESGK